MDHKNRRHVKTSTPRSPLAALDAFTKASFEDMRTKAEDRSNQCVSLLSTLFARMDQLHDHDDRGKKFLDNLHRMSLKARGFGAVGARTQDEWLRVKCTALIRELPEVSKVFHDIKVDSSNGEK